jgi:hypothetical protein
MRRIALLASALILLAGCIPDTRPAACDAPEIEIALTLSESALEPAPAVCRGQEVTLVVSSQVDGVLHIHGYDAEVPATQVRRRRGHGDGTSRPAGADSSRSSSIRWTIPVE